MNKPKQIKELITPKRVVQYYLGQPQKTSRMNLIYKSPFRNERTPSFWVSNEKGIHDFGTGIHYDTISFVQELFRIDFKTALSKLCNDFGIMDCEPISKELEQYLIRKREEELQIRKNINRWFYSTFSKLCDELQEWQKIIPHLNKEALAIAYAKEQYLDYLTDLFIDAKEDDKIKLWKDKEEIEKWIIEI